MQLDGIEGRVAVVTGGARGIGLLHGRDASVTSVPAPPRSTWLRGDRRRAQRRSVDVGDEASVDRRPCRGRTRGSAVPQLVVLNAGVLHKAPLEEHTLERLATGHRRESDGTVSVRAPRRSAACAGGLRTAGRGRLERRNQRRRSRSSGAPGLRRVEGRSHGAREVDRPRVCAAWRDRQRVAPTLIDTGMLSTLDATSARRSRSAATAARRRSLTWSCSCAPRTADISPARSWTSTAATSSTERRSIRCTSTTAATQPARAAATGGEPRPGRGHQPAAPRGGSRPRVRAIQFRTPAPASASLSAPTGD